MHLKRNRENWLFILLIAVLLTAQAPQSPFGSANVDAILDGLGTVVLLFGAVVRVCARGWKQEQRAAQLVISGPYSLVRHPLYLGTLLGLVGVCMIHGSILVFGLSLLAFVVWYGRLIRREESRLGAEWPKAHQAYCARVPRLIPTPRGLAALVSTWPRDVRGAMSQEADSLFLLPIAGILIRVWEIAESGALWRTHAAQAIALFVVIGVLVATWVSIRQPHPRRRTPKLRAPGS